ncbi:serine hydrolase domain-containing protein [Carboxylicivirga taeanensis]|uniref:serine hydrolase domain-containing protein n=1 Tax=Carboxylicivirga taeanensis TaxID=1416875 RepID=UPI003F6DF0F4
MKLNAAIACLMLIVGIAQFGEAQTQKTDSLGELEALYESLASFKLVKHSDDNFPVADLLSEKIGFYVPNKADEWQSLVLRYMTVPVYESAIGSISKQIDVDSVEHLIIAANEHLEMLPTDIGPRNLKLTLLFFGDSLCIDDPLLQPFDNVLVCSSNTSLSRNLAVQVVFNALTIEEGGRIAIDLDNTQQRMKYLPPALMGLNQGLIKERVDSVVNGAIAAGAFPGCRVIVAVRGTVIFNESYGFHTYNNRIMVDEHDVYDLASVTKITGPLPLIMKACGEGLMQLDAPFYHYWPDWNKRLFHRSNKEGMSLREVLAHQARLTPYINYYQKLMDDGKYDKRYFSINKTDKYTLPIDRHLFLSNAFKKEIYKTIRKSPLLPEAKYKYSGLSYMIYPELLANLYGLDYESLLYAHFFKPLGASSLCYNPLGKIDEARIVPTEYDGHFRKQQIKGLVHDEAAAVMGGVSGNAGLFGSAGDLMKLMQLYLQKGSYAGRQYLSEDVVNEFTKVQFPDNDNRRGAGFDKPLFGNDTLSIAASYPAPGVSASSYGHSGFTGTFVWIDPDYELVYIFLSNRVYPTRNNPLIYQMNVRPRIQQIFYDALNETEAYQSSGKP